MEGDGPVYDAIDVDRPARQLKTKDLDMKAFEICSGRHTLKRSMDEQNLSKKPVDEDYIKYLKSLASTSESSSSLDEGSDDIDGNVDVDPQYRLFLANLKEDGLSYKLEIATKNGMVSVMYEGKDDLNDECGMHSPNGSETVMVTENAENEEIQNIGNSISGGRDIVNAETNLKSEASKSTSLSPRRDEIGTSTSPLRCNNIKHSTQSMRNEIRRESQNFSDENPNLRVSRRKKLETSKSPRSVVHKHVVGTGMLVENDRGREKRKPVAEKDWMSKNATHGLEKTNEPSSKKSRAKWNDIFGCDWQHELNADDTDGCYLDFLNSCKLEGDCLMYVAEGLKPVKHEVLDVISSYDPEVFVTSNASDFDEGGRNPFKTRNPYQSPVNGQRSLRSHEGETNSVFREKLMSQLEKPYDDIEYENLWNEITKERRKVIHKDLRGTGSVKAFTLDELTPSYLDTYPHLRKKINDAGSDRLKRLNYLRGFFFWLENVPHGDAFRPWKDGQVLEVMEKNC